MQLTIMEILPIQLTYFFIYLNKKYCTCSLIISIIWELKFLHFGNISELAHLPATSINNL